MRVTVTGAAGFIGSHLCELLVSEGIEVVGLDNFDDFYDAARKRANLSTLTRKPGFRLVEGDIRDRSQLLRAIAGSDAIVHLAARAGVRPSFLQPALYADVNVTGTATLLELAAEVGTDRIVFASSSSVYGRGADTPFDEEGSLGVPASPYASTKLAGEMLCQNFASRFAAVTILRLFTVYGPRQRPDLAIHKFARAMTAGRPIPVFGRGDSFRDYTYIEDIVTGVRATLEIETGYEVVNLGSGAPITLDEMIRGLEAALQLNAQRETLPLQDGDLFGTWASIERASRVLGYRPRWTFDEGVRSFAEWFSNSGTHATEEREIV